MFFYYSFSSWPAKTKANQNQKRSNSPIAASPPSLLALFTSTSRLFLRPHVTLCWIEQLLLLF
jgi:hypothetical protein